MATGQSRTSSSRAEDIKKWQIQTRDGDERTVSTANISTLYDGLMSFLKAILAHTREQGTEVSYYSSLEQSIATLFFWGRDFGVSQGELDAALQYSHRLRDTVLTLLVALGDLLNLGLVQVVPTVEERQALSKTSKVASLTENAKLLIDEPVQAANYNGETIEQLCKSLKNIIEGLTILSPSLEAIADDESDEEEARAWVQLKDRAAHEYFIDIVSSRFPSASQQLVQALGQSNWDRYNYIQRLRENAIDEPTLVGTDKARSEFHDSGIGSSAPAQSVVAIDRLEYAATVVSIRMLFKDREAMTSHLESQHGMINESTSSTCPLCLEEIYGGRDIVFLHFSRHMEEIALGVLPQGSQSEDGSASSDDEGVEQPPNDALQSDGSHDLPPEKLPGSIPISKAPTEEGSAHSTSARFQRRGHVVGRLKCYSCKRDKQQCMPQERKWPQRCDRCVKRDLPCSEGLPRPRRQTLNSTPAQSVNRDEFQNTHDQKPLTSTTRLSTSFEGDEEPYTTKCICGYSDDDGNTVLCESCDTLQHIQCYYESVGEVPDVHECGDCNPRPLDFVRAQKRQQHQVWYNSDYSKLLKASEAFLEDVPPTTGHGGRTRELTIEFGSKLDEHGFLQTAAQAREHDNNDSSESADPGSEAYVPPERVTCVYRSTRGERCVNVEEHHFKGHRDKRGRIIGTGPYEGDDEILPSVKDWPSNLAARDVEQRQMRQQNGLPNLSSARLGSLTGDEHLGQASLEMSSHSYDKHLLSRLNTNSVQSASHEKSEAAKIGLQAAQRAHAQQADNSSHRHLDNEKGARLGHDGREPWIEQQSSAMLPPPRHPTSHSELHDNLGDWGPVYHFAGHGDSESMSHQSTTVTGPASALPALEELAPPSVLREATSGTSNHRRGPWSPHEDRYLIELVNRNGPHNWVRNSQELGTRSPKQCRERYHQNLKPTLNRDPITPEEGELIEQLVGEMGKRWAQIARRLKDRSDNAVKEWWNGSHRRMTNHKK
ncbi:18S rRNA maturation protein [Didymosphaeria variabile]|uniref:18S rRNA maturation protein n=1 Tax=Didymosphaeria variabile TaxID=1932322 RepID=A0A9W9CF91_9PLEO|nr:18S rRNA maturation protein [Didymosphaeria variabile]KAJ4358715.1 18S rRNA maturation protein [Didymosphaeria variabile]